MNHREWDARALKSTRQSSGVLLRLILRSGEIKHIKSRIWGGNNGKEQHVCELHYHTLDCPIALYMKAPLCSWIHVAFLPFRLLIVASEPHMPI